MPWQKERKMVRDVSAGAAVDSPNTRQDPATWTGECVSRDGDDATVRAYKTGGLKRETHKTHHRQRMGNKGGQHMRCLLTAPTRGHPK